MENIFIENPYKKEFIAEIINVIERDTKYHIELDNTFFYPESESQPSDTGYINGIAVTFVYKEDETIFHVLDKKPAKIHRATCIIDFEKKFDFMQQNLGQKILSYCFMERLKANTLKTNIQSNSCYIDLDKITETAEIRNIEKMANEIISDNLKIDTFYATNSEVKKIFSKKIHITGNYKTRIVKIGDIVVIPCNALYPLSTVEAQIIKIVKVETGSAFTRIEFLCGSRAVHDYFIRYEALETMTHLLSCKYEELLPKVDNLSTELKKNIAEKNLLKSQVADFEVQKLLLSCKNINSVRVLKSIYTDVDVKYINSLASKLVLFPKVVVLFGLQIQDKTHVIFMKSKDLKLISMDSLIKDAITLIDGKGGGNEFSAQGAGKNSNNLSSCLEYTYRKISDSIVADQSLL